MQIQFSYESTEVLTKLEITLKLSVLFNPTSHGVSDSVASILVYFGIICKKSARSLKN